MDRKKLKVTLRVLGWWWCLQNRGFEKKRQVGGR